MGLGDDKRHGGSAAAFDTDGNGKLTDADAASGTLKGLPGSEILVVGRGLGTLRLRNMPIIKPPKTLPQALIIWNLGHPLR
jgi:hypothetical protein